MADDSHLRDATIELKAIYDRCNTLALALEESKSQLEQLKRMLEEQRREHPCCEAVKEIDLTEGLINKQFKTIDERLVALGDMREQVLVRWQRDVLPRRTPLAG